MFVAERIISMIAPHLCIGCGKEGEVLCAWCMPDAVTDIPDRCYRCHATTKNSRVCHRCQSGSRLRIVWVRTEYDGLAKKLIHDFKFARKKAAYMPIANIMSEILPILPTGTIVTFAPTATSRVRKRGYDHSKLLAKHIAKSHGLVFSELLERHGQTRQVGSDRLSRIKHMESSFSVRKKQDVQGARILVVDDLVTTGATLEATASVLRSEGAKHVDGLVFAQKL